MKGTVTLMEVKNVTVPLRCGVSPVCTPTFLDDLILRS
jgi:hypothetical protein